MFKSFSLSVPENKGQREDQYKDQRIEFIEVAVQKGLRRWMGDIFDIHRQPDGTLLPVAQYARPVPGAVPVLTVVPAWLNGKRYWEIYRLLDGGNERGPLVHRVTGKDRQVQ